MQILLSGYKTTLSNILKNKQTFFLSVGTITISIFILGLFSLFFTNLNEFLSKLNVYVAFAVIFGIFIEIETKLPEQGAHLAISS